MCTWLWRRSTADVYAGIGLQENGNEKVSIGQRSWMFVYINFNMTYSPQALTNQTPNPSARFNFSNKHEPYFMLDRLEKLSALMATENNSLSCVVYAINQKGASQGIVIPNFEIGHVHRFQSGSYMYPTSICQPVEWRASSTFVMRRKLPLDASI